MMSEATDISTFLDEEGRITQWPSENKVIALALSEYLASRISPTFTLNEQAIIHLINRWHTFGKAEQILQDLITAGLIKRDEMGTAFWRE